MDKEDILETFEAQMKCAVDLIKYIAPAAEIIQADSTHFRVIVEDGKRTASGSLKVVWDEDDEHFEALILVEMR